MQLQVASELSAANRKEITGVAKSEYRAVPQRRKHAESTKDVDGWSKSYADALQICAGPQIAWSKAVMGPVLSSVCRVITSKSVRAAVVHWGCFPRSFDG